MNTEYTKYINSEKWKNLKVDLILTRGSKCQRCGAKRKPSFLHLHHLTYERFKNEEPKDLELLCAGCHAFEHGKLKLKEKKVKIKPKKKPKKKIKKSPIDQKWEAMRTKFGFGKI